MCSATTRNACPKSVLPPIVSRAIIKVQPSTNLPPPHDLPVKSILLFVLVPTALWAFSTQRVVAAEGSPEFASLGIEFIKTHCADCHGSEEPEAGLSLTSFRTNAALIPQRAKWDAILRMVETGVMPPPDSPQPPADERKAFTGLVRAIFDEHDRTAPPDPGRVTMRRLNRREYANTVRDLLGVDFNPTENFPADDVGHGFDNIGDVLTLSPLLMERYLDAAETIAGRVILVDPPKPSIRYLSSRYLQPSGEFKGRFRTMDTTSEDPKVAGPFTAPGGYLKFTNDADLYFRATLFAETNSESPVTVALYIQGNDLTDVSTEDELAALVCDNRDRLKNAKILKTFEITARSAEQRQTIEVLIQRNGSINNAGIALVAPPAGEPPAILRIEHLWSEGPLETRPASQLMILGDSSETPSAEQRREVTTRLLRRAFRRIPTDLEKERYVGFVDSAMTAGARWEGAMQHVIQAILCSPKFLFRVETDDRPTSPATRPIDEFQLASRLSYFLWSTMPDDELLELAEKRMLSSQLDEQVRRMLADDKSQELVRNFGRQWLQIGRLEMASPDPQRFPSFNEPLRAAMLEETELFFASVMREDRSILELLNADYTFVNEPLAKHYGIADTNGNLRGQQATQPKGQPIRGNGFVRVSLPHAMRGGLVTQASVLTVTSNPTRTSPVKRGKWVMEQLLGAPPPPPPPNVPELEGEGRALTGSLREQMEQHRADPNCAVCHTTMDPLGFSFENYDAIGAWRTKDGEHDIDASGELPDGTQFSGPGGLKDILLARKDDFATCLAEKMLIYALGRGLEYYDRPTLTGVVQRLAKNNYRFSSLVTEIVKSEPFVNRRGISD